MNMGVPYTPTIDQHGKGTVKKNVIKIPDSTPCPTVKSRSVVGAENDMFVQLSPLASAKTFLQNQNEHTERHPMAFTPPTCSLGLYLSQPEQPIDVVHVSFAFPIDVGPMIAQPNVGGRKTVKFAEPIVQGTPDDILPSLHEAYCKMEEDAINRKSLNKQALSSSNAPPAFSSDDVVSSATPSSVGQARVVQPPPVEDYEPEIRSTKDQQALYELVKRFGNARSNNAHMKKIRETKTIQCKSTYIDLGELAEAMKPTGKLTRNLITAGIEFINDHMDIHVDKTIMPPSITRRIWDGNFSHPEIRKVFAQHGKFKLTLKHFVMVPMFQELAPDDPKDKAGHFYTVCINLKKQRFKVQDSVRSEDDNSPHSHVDYFITNLKETWDRHYGSSKVQISNFPIKYITTTK